MRSQADRQREAMRSSVDELPAARVAAGVASQQLVTSGHPKRTSREDFGPLAVDVDRLKELVDAFEKAGKPTDGPTRDAVLMQLTNLTSQFESTASFAVSAPPVSSGSPMLQHSQGSQNLRTGTEVAAEDMRFCTIPEHSSSAPPSRTRSGRRSSPWRGDPPSGATSERKTNRTGSSGQARAATPCVSNYGGRFDEKPVRDGTTVKRARSVGGAIPVRHTKASQLRQAALQSRTASPGCSPSVSPRQSPERRSPSRGGRRATAEGASAAATGTVDSGGFLDDSALDTSLRSHSELEALAGSLSSSPSELGSSDGPRSVRAPVTELKPRCVCDSASTPEHLGSSAHLVRLRHGEARRTGDSQSAGQPESPGSTGLGESSLGSRFTGPGGPGSPAGSPPVQNSLGCLVARAQLGCHSWSQPAMQTSVRVPGAPPPVSPAQLPRLVMPQGSSLGAPVSQTPSPIQPMLMRPAYSGVHNSVNTLR